MKKNILSLAALLIASATAFTACSSSDDSIISENQQPAQTTGKYTMTVQASKGDGASTRALTLDGNTLNATWATTENVYVKKGSSWATGSLVPDANAATANLTGSLSGVTIAADDVLTLQFPRSGALDYSGQVGTLADIAAKYDYATATVTVADVSATGNITVNEPATFTNQQSIAKFTLKDKESNALLSPSKITVSVPTPAAYVAILGETAMNYEFTIPATTYETNGNGVVYLAIKNLPASLTVLKNSLTLNITATVGTDTYTYTKTGWPFEDGKYYEITVKMKAPAPAYPLLSAATAEDIGKVVCAAGHLHDAKTAVPDGCTAVGILGKVTETGHGLILALQDATSQTWNTINGWTSVTKYAGTTLKVLPDKDALGSLTSFEKLGDTFVSNWAVAQKSDYDAIFTNLGSTQGDTDGTTCDDTVNAYITTGVSGTPISGDYWSATEKYENTPWYFATYWDGGNVDDNYSVRPVLGF